MWYKNGKLHRDDDLPAVIEYDKEGQVKKSSTGDMGKYIVSTILPKFGFMGMGRHQGYIITIMAKFMLKFGFGIMDKLSGLSTIKRAGPQKYYIIRILNV